MRIRITFVTKIKIDHNYYGLNLDEVLGHSDSMDYFYSGHYFNEIPLRVKNLLAS